MKPHARTSSLIIAASLLVLSSCDRKQRSPDADRKHDDKAHEGEKSEKHAKKDKSKKSKSDKKHDKDHDKDKHAPKKVETSEAKADAQKIDFGAPYEQKPEIRTEYKNGLIVEDFVLGEGEGALDGSRAHIHYTGYLMDGTIFDSSVKNNRPAFPVTVGQGRVIKGWEQGLQGMKQGGKRKLIIPPELGYGKRNMGKIPPNSTLIFTLEMVELRAPLGEPKDESAFETKPVARKRLDQGLRVTDYAIGEGESAESGDTVLVHYTGKLSDGTVFDSSIPRGRVFEFPLGAGRVIKGWDMGIEGMKVGGLRRLEIPAALGYGDRDMGKIPPKSKLTFTVELMDVVKAEKKVETPEGSTGDAEKKEDAPAKDAKHEGAEKAPEKSDTEHSATDKQEKAQE